jgi:hypothetical protein
MMAKTVKKIETRPEPMLRVATVVAPPSDELELLGIVACSGEWNLSDFGTIVDDLAAKLSEAALKKFPTATALYHLRWFPGKGHFGHVWTDGTADVYGPRVRVESEPVGPITPRVARDEVESEAIAPTDHKAHDYCPAVWKGSNSLGCTRPVHEEGDHVVGKGGLIVARWSMIEEVTTKRTKGGGRR